ncbi:hypothetical protein BCR37DRAFT_391461 [Protomyces lactucae-debilis]|uniref:Arrestin C-terminal-like domain-containing protein n=1 Tax=Protomyces lactucae-debilis TaxID=2754530 RepID=A0A1Y2FP43_PROLT|nr:uncharacterized protein BCR37DRAFT_391461 [Protomyces lactucae-debilis]ORY85699.1 hypothetical protein BCR37DRAFT_391461 [Protomyces lactucae-debilis]
MKHTAKSNIISIRAPPHVELAVGFNGIRATRPRLTGTVEVRSPAGNPIPVVFISLALYVHENTVCSPPGKSLVSPSQKLSTTTLVGKELLLWEAQEASGYQTLEVLSMDIPFCMPLPEETLPATLIHPSRSTTYELVATLHASGINSERFAIEVIMERFDHLPIWGMFEQTQKLLPVSVDHIVEMQCMLPRTCVGPGDRLTTTVTLVGNPDWEAKVKKVRCKELLFTIEQVVRYQIDQVFEAFVVTKRLAESRRDLMGAKLADCEGPLEVGITMPVTGRLNDKAIVPHATYTSTTSGKLYSVSFQVVIRASFKGAKEITATHPIIVSQYTECLGST